MIGIVTNCFLLKLPQIDFLNLFFIVYIEYKKYLCNNNRYLQ